MAVIFVTICTFVLFFFFDVLLRLSRIFARKRSLALIEKYAREVARLIFALLRSYCDFSVVFENHLDRPLPERFLLVANHQSLIDILICVGYFKEHGLRFIAKRELGSGIPFVSALLRVQGHALIRRRGASIDAMKTIVRFARRCRREGTCPVIFPEGHRSKDGKLGNFHTAGLRQVLDVEPLPILVLTLDSGNSRVSRLFEAFKNLQGSRYHCRICALLPAPQGKEESIEALKRCRSIIEVELDSMRACP